MTTKSAVSRRYLIATGAGSVAMALGGRARAHSAGAADAARPRESMIRTWYSGWVKKDWPTVDRLAADEFTFSSAAGDDHISKSRFKTQCWDTQSALIDAFDLESVLDDEREAFVAYACRTKSGKTFRNVEHFVFKGDQIASIECYFGGAGYPSAADKAKR